MMKGGRPDNRINVLFCINDEFAQHCAVTIASMAHADPASDYNVIIASTGLTQTNRQRLAEMETRFSTLTIGFEDFDAARLQGFPVNPAYPPDVYMRFWIADFFGPETARALYLDADLVMRSSIRPLWETELATNEIVAASEIVGATVQDRANIPNDSPYFNSGVMLFDLEKWRTNNLLDQLFTFLDTHGEKVRNLDQDALNGVLHERWHELDIAWNAITPYFRREDPHGLGKARQKKLLNAACIIHFNGAGKPWHTAVRHPFKKLYWTYLSMTPWADYKAPDDTVMSRLKYWFGPLVERLKSG